jgi:hypothetical protein
MLPTDTNRAHPRMKIERGVSSTARAGTIRPVLPLPRHVATGW